MKRAKIEARITKGITITQLMLLIEQIICIYMKYYKLSIIISMIIIILLGLKIALTEWK